MTRSARSATSKGGRREFKDNDRIDHDSRAWQVAKNRPPVGRL